MPMAAGGLERRGMSMGMALMRGLESPSQHHPSWQLSSQLSSPMQGINSSHHAHFPHHPAAQFGDMRDGDERELSEMHGMEELVECMSAEDAAIALRRRKWHKGGGLLPHNQALPHDARLR